MLTRYSAWINGQGLQDIDDSIYILDIVEKDPDAEIVRAERSMSGGTRYIRTNRHSLSVVIRFAVRERDPARRADVVSRVRAWAQRGWLTTSDKPGKRLYVVCEYLPMIDSAVRWAETLEMTLTAYDVPWWEDEQPDAVNGVSTYAGERGERCVLSICNRGTTDAPVSVQVTAQGNIDRLLVYMADDNSLAFESLGMKAGDVLSIAYDERGIVSLKVGDRSVMDKRRGVSSDNVMCPPGRRDMVVQWAESPFTVRASVRGRWL